MASLEKALELAKKQVQAIVTQVQTFLDMHQVISAGPFLYAFIQEVINYTVKPVLNQTSFGPCFVFRIDRCFIYTG